MKYIGTFRDIDNNEYTLNIITNRSETYESEITLTEQPFNVEMDETDENIYKPVKYQAATISILTKNENDYMFDVYSGHANNTIIKLFDEDDNLVWGGFATPVLYDNGYTSVHENLQIEAIDGLSILQYYKYAASPKTVKSFVDIIDYLLTKAEIYGEYYISASQKLNSSDTTSLINNLYISEQNFFDEKDDNETDDDVAWTCQEVLEEICQYLGLVCVGDGDKVYFLDLDALKNNVNTYWKYTIGNTTPEQVTLSETIAVTGDMYRGNNSSISLDNVYNKVSITDDFYKFDDVIPDIYDTAQNITKSSDDDLKNSTHIENGMWGEVVQGDPGNTEGDSNNNMIIFIDRIYDPEDEEYTDYNAIAVKYFKHPYYQFYSYKNTSNDALNYTDTKTLFGACIAKFFVKKLEKTVYENWFDYLAQLVTGQKGSLDEWLAKNEVSTISFDNYIMMVNPLTNHINNTDITSYPYFKTVGSDTTSLFGGDNAYLVIKGSYVYHYFNEDPYPIPEDEPDIDHGRYAMDAGQTYLLAKLYWGGQWWNGTEWVNTEATFKIPYMQENASSEERRADATMFKKIEFVNTVSWRMGIGEKGYIIPVPEGKVLVGAPELTVYKSFDPNYHSTSSGDNEGHYYKHSVVFLKNFAIKAVIGDPTYSDVNKTDTTYTNVIDNNNVSDLKEIKFKICTNDNKSPNYSSVGYKDNDEFHFLNTIYNSALTDNGVIDYKGETNNGNLRPEEWMIYRLTNQYTQPKIRLKLTLKRRFNPYTIITDHWLAGKRFIVDSQSTDFENGITTVTLVEKG